MFNKCFQKEVAFFSFELCCMLYATKNRFSISKINLKCWRTLKFEGFYKIQNTKYGIYWWRTGYCQTGYHFITFCVIPVWSRALFILSHRFWRIFCHTILEIQCYFTFRINIVKFCNKSLRKRLMVSNYFYSNKSSVGVITLKLNSKWPLNINWILIWSNNSVWY